MNKILLVTRPEYDDGTAYLSYYASLILKEAENENIRVKDFPGEKANKEEITKFIFNKNPLLIFTNGHGNETSLFGHKDSLLFSSEENISFLKDKIVYARACNAGKIFGKKVVENNNGCFIGYLYPFSFWIDEKWSAKPSNDNTAKLYLEPSNEIIISLIQGKSAFDSHEKSKKMMIANMKKIMKMQEKREPMAMNMLQVLWNNYEGQVIYGNKEFKFV